MSAANLFSMSTTPYSWVTPKRVVAAIALVALVVGACVLGKGWWRDRLASEQLAALRARQIPTTSEELNDYYAVPSGTPDATAAWMKPIDGWWGKLVGRHPYGFGVLDRYGEFPPEPGHEWPDLARAEAYVATHQKFYGLVDQAIATQGPCCFIDNFGDDSLILPHVDGLRAVVRFLAIRAYVAAHRGRWPEVMVDLRGSVSAAETLAREPLLITQLVRIRLLGQSLHLLQGLLSPGRYTDGELTGLQRQLDSIDLRDGLQRAVIGQRVRSIQSISDSVEGRLRGAWLESDPLSVIQTMRELDEHLADDWPGPLELTRRQQQDLDFREIGKETPWGDRYVGDVHIGMMISSRVEQFAVTTARLRAAIAGIAAARFFDRSGRWPESLDELVPQFLEGVPADPFAGQPLKYATDGQGIRIYSVGRNNSDDGGEETPELLEDEGRYHRGNPDVVFCLHNADRK